MGGFAEVLLEEHAPPRVVLVDGASERARATRAPDAAGGATLRASARDAPNAGRRRLLTWAITADDGAAIHLAETPTGGVGAPPARAVRVVFPDVLLPMACVVEPAAADPGAPAVVVAVDVAGVAYRVRVPPPTSDRPDATFLSSIDATHVDAVDVSAALAPLEGPTAIAAVGTRVVAVGGASGRVALLDASTLSLVAELKPPTLARLWNAVAGTGGGARAVRGLAMVPRATRDAPVYLAALRADCHFQIFDVTSPSRPVAALGVTLPAAAALFGGIDQSGGDGSGMRARAASAMHVAEGFLAVATRDASAEERASGTPPTNASSSPPRARPPCRCTRSIAGWARRRARRRPSRFARRYAEARETWSRFAFATAPCGRSAPTARFAGGRWTRSIARTRAPPSATPRGNSGSGNTGARAWRARAAPSPRYYPGAAAMEAALTLAPRAPRTSPTI